MNGTTITPRSIPPLFSADDRYTPVTTTESSGPRIWFEAAKGKKRGALIPQTQFTLAVNVADTTYSIP